MHENGVLSKKCMACNVKHVTSRAISTKMEPESPEEYEKSEKMNETQTLISVSALTLRKRIWCNREIVARDIVTKRHGG
jgi:hypothetical protein